jgi:hypothetical protein
MRVCIRVQLLELEHCWSIPTVNFDSPRYSSNLAPSDYHIFTYLKNRLRLQLFSNNEDLMEGVKMWLNSRVADFFDKGIRKLFPDTGASIPAVTTLRSSLGMKISFYIIIFPSLLVLLTAHLRLLPE